MNIFKSLAVFSLFCVNVSNAQVGIGVPAENIHPSAELEVKSNTKGFLPPRMTKAERDAIVTPAAGLLIYQTDGDETNPTGLYFFDGTAWKNGLGLKGETGAVGPKGDTGAQGIQGPAGANGTNGAQGLQGVKGDKGETGSTGPQGIQGLTGPQGDAGVTGTQGIKGEKGDTGSTGPTGSQGSQGIQGVKGDKGDVGATGPQGEPGLTGPQGITGSGSSIVVNNSTSLITNRLCFTNGTSGTAVNSLLTNNALTFTPGIGNLSSILFTGNLTGNVTGNASSASQVAVSPSVSSSTSNYLSFSPSTSGVSDLKTNNALTFVPSTGNLSATTFTGNVTGNVTGNATSASQVAVTSTSANTDRYLSFSPSTDGVSNLQTNPGLTFNPGTRTLFTSNINALNITGSLTGNASSASDLEGGAAGAIPYQSSVGTTSFIPGGTAGQVLTSNGVSAPSWKSSDSFYPLNFGGDTQNPSFSGTKYFVPQGSCHDITYTFSDVQTRSVVAITGLVYSFTWNVSEPLFSPLSTTISIIKNGVTVYTSPSGIFSSPTGVCILPTGIPIIAGNYLELRSNGGNLGNCQFQFAIKVTQ